MVVAASTGGAVASALGMAGSGSATVFVLEPGTTDGGADKVVSFRTSLDCILDTMTGLWVEASSVEDDTGGFVPDVDGRSAEASLMGSIGNVVVGATSAGGGGGWKMRD